jgi:GINS complex subunit 3
MVDTTKLSHHSRNSNSSANLTLDLPKCLSGQVLNALKADPRTVLLRPLAAHFYALGSRILELFEDEELADVLGDVSRCACSVNLDFC